MKGKSDTCEGQQTLEVFVTIQKKDCCDQVPWHVEGGVGFQKCTLFYFDCTDMQMAITIACFYFSPNLRNIVNKQKVKEDSI